MINLQIINAILVRWKARWESSLSFLRNVTHTFFFSFLFLRMECNTYLIGLFILIYYYILISHQQHDKYNFFFFFKLTYQFIKVTNKNCITLMWEHNLFVRFGGIFTPGQGLDLVTCKAWHPARLCPLGECGHAHFTKSHIA